MSESVHPEEVSLVGGRRFWVYDSGPSNPGVDPSAFRATFQALESDFDHTPESPVGVCLMLTPDEARSRPEAEWPDPRTFYAGYLDDGRQVRIAYFANASISGEARPRPSPDWRLKPGYRVVPLAGQDAVKSDDVVGLWLREGVLSYAEAKRRLAEVLLVATDDSGSPVGVCTAYLQRHEQLRTDMWHFRLFVGAAHRQSAVASALSSEGCAHLGSRFVTGQDQRAIGIVYEIESEFLKRAFTMATWERVDFTFIGETAQGAHVRVHYFPGALAPGGA